MLFQALSPVVDFVYPPRCPLCGEGISAQAGLCVACWSALVIPGKPACASCQRPFSDESVGDGAICAVCMADPPAHDGIASGTLYNDTSRQLVLAFKHGKRLALSAMLARLMVARLPELSGEWLVVPVPLHRTRLWQRGFNQSALLARDLARSRGLTLVVDGLVRKKATPMLGGLGKKARARELTGAIEVRKAQRERMRGAQVILVDDVLTSGATSEACVKVLKRAGASRVMIACFARVLDEAL